MKQGVVRIGVSVAGGLVVAGGLLVLAYRVAGRALDAKPSAQAAAAAPCAHYGAAHTATVHGNSIMPAHTAAKLCDTLTITNADDQIRLMAFGPHDDHQPYDGVTERTLAQDQSLTVVLNQAGTFTFHDHLDDAAVGTFTVTP